MRRYKSLYGKAEGNDSTKFGSGKPKSGLDCNWKFESSSDLDTSDRADAREA